MLLQGNLLIQFLVSSCFKIISELMIVCYCLDYTKLVYQGGCVYFLKDKYNDIPIESRTRLKLKNQLGSVRLVELDNKLITPSVQ